MERDHYSKEWDDAPMPFSIFFTQKGHAIHGSLDVKRLGSPASHGCVRLLPANAEKLFALVEQEGVLNTTVVLTGVAPSGAPAVARRAPRPIRTRTYAQPQYGQPQYQPAARPAAIRPAAQYGSSQYGQPQYAQPQYAAAAAYTRSRSTRNRITASRNTRSRNMRQPRRAARAMSIATPMASRTGAPAQPVPVQ